MLEIIHDIIEKHFGLGSAVGVCFGIIISIIVLVMLLLIGILKGELLISWRVIVFLLGIIIGLGFLFHGFN